MSGQDIAQKLFELEDELEKTITFTTYVLNPRITEIEEQIKHLKSICNHEFEDDICVYCGSTKGELNA